MYINQVNIWPIHACSTHMNSNKLQLHTQIRHTHTHTHKHAFLIAAPAWAAD